MLTKNLAHFILTFGMLSAATTWGDNFSFSLGVGHAHHRPPCYAPHFGAHYHWYAPPPRYVYVEPPVIQERIYVQPSVVQERVVVQQPAPSYQTRYSAPTIARNADPVSAPASEAPVVIRNQSGKGYNVGFVVNDSSAELADGQSRTFSGAGKHIIEFDRGGERGTAHYELEGGLYSFVITNNGWDLVKDTSTPTQTAKRPLLRRNELPEDMKLR